MKKVEAYKCDYCRMLSRFKWRTKKHEAETCKKNPNRKACLTCANLRKRKHGEPTCVIGGEHIPMYHNSVAEVEVWTGINAVVDCDDYKFNATGTIQDEKE